MGFDPPTDRVREALRLARKFNSPPRPLVGQLRIDLQRLESLYAQFTARERAQYRRAMNRRRKIGVIR